MMDESASADPYRSSRQASLPPGGQSESSSADRRGQLSLAFLAVSGAILLGFLVVRISATNALLELGPEPAAMLSQHHPGIFLNRAQAELELSGRTSEETERAAFEAFKSAPLSEIPLLVAAHNALARGDGAKADRLIAAALRRNGRSRYALLLQLDRDLRNRRAREAVATMAVLTRIFPAAGEVLVFELAQMGADPDTQPAVRRVMETDPQIRTNVLEQLARQGADPIAILSLAGPREMSGTGGETPRWQRLMLDGMVERGDVARGRQVWMRLAGADPASPAAGVYDPAFTGLPGPPPFNWNLETSAEGIAERITGSGGLHIEYYGRRDTRLASQLMLLPPGRYQLSVRAERPAEGEEGHLSWTVSCHPSNRRLAEIRMIGLDYRAKQISGGFAVPESGCSSQWLRLVGTAAEFSRGQQVTVRQLRIARVAPG